MYTRPSHVSLLVDGEVLHISHTQRILGLKAALVYETRQRLAVLLFHAHVRIDPTACVFAHVCPNKLVQSRLRVASQHAKQGCIFCFRKWDMDAGVCLFFCKQPKQPMKWSMVVTVRVVFCNTRQSVRRSCEKTCDCVKKNRHHTALRWSVLSDTHCFFDSIYVGFYRLGTRMCSNVA